jgi:acetyl esterase/lipase
MERRAQQEQHQDPDEIDDGSTDASASIPAGVHVIRDIVYGNHPLQRFDAYLPAQVKPGAPVIFMVHGGAWKHGDKAMARVVQNKVARWVPRGFIFVSVNYRMLPGTKPIDQARDVAQALATAQRQAASWGGNPDKFILMGHSAGAHLVALLGVSPAMVAAAGARPWLGTIPLDSAALDVVQIMENRHLRLYDTAFGKDPDYWRLASPFHQITQTGRPFFIVCSSKRSYSCPSAHAFVATLATVGTQGSVLEERMTHREINERLGEEPAYTAAVEDFMRQLDPTVASLLRAP